MTPSLWKGTLLQVVKIMLSKLVNVRGKLNTNGAMGTNFKSRVKRDLWMRWITYWKMNFMLKENAFHSGSVLTRCPYLTVHGIWCVKVYLNILKNIKYYPCNRPGGPIGFWDVETPTLSRQSVHRWRWNCQAYAPAALYPQTVSWYSFLLEAESPQDHSAAGRIRSTENIQNRNRDLPACSIVPQPTTLLRAPF
jgi:hypothetical protein